MAQTKSSPQPKKAKKSTVKKLADFFLRNGYLRVPSEKKSKKSKYADKKGYEIRFVARNKKELSEMKSLLKDAGFKAGKPFDKFNQYVLPVYGKEQFFRFKNLLAELKIRIRNHKA